MIIRGLFSSVLHKNIRCGFSLELPRRSDSNEYPQYTFFSLESPRNEYPEHMFLWRNKQNYPLSQNTLLICSTEFQIFACLTVSYTG